MEALTTYEIDAATARPERQRRNEEREGPSEGVRQASLGVSGDRLWQLGLRCRPLKRTPLSGAMPVRSR